MEFDAVADELYGLPPGRFTPVRSERVAQARKGGDRGLAQQISRLRRPTAAAWAVNLLVRGHGEEVQALLRLGDDLRRAQAGLAGDELRRLTSHRRQVVAALARRARMDAHAADQPISDAVEEEVSQTLLAALADPVAAVAVSQGRLTKALEYSGVGLPVGPESVATAASAPPAQEAGPREQGRRDEERREQNQRSQKQRDQEQREQRQRDQERREQEQREQAESALLSARAELADLEAHAQAADRVHAQARATQDETQATVERLEADLDAARESVGAARDRVGEAERGRRVAQRRADAGRRAVERAEAALADLTATTLTQTRRSST